MVCRMCMWVPRTRLAVQGCTVLVHSFQIAKLMYKVVRKQARWGKGYQKKEKGEDKNKSRIYQIGNHMEGFRRNMVKIMMTWQWANKKPRTSKCSSRCNSNSGRRHANSFCFSPAGEGWYRDEKDGLDVHLEGEATAATRLAAEGVTACLGETAAAAAVHHVEQDVGVDVDVAGAAAHTAHSTHTTHSTHTAEAASAETTTAAEHVVGVHQVITVIVSGTFPGRGISYVIVARLGE